jgi:tRNA(Arg) A34 adenosine deaminase TadA
MDHNAYMARAVAVCRSGIAQGQTPFGSVIVRDGRIVAEAHNTVWRDTDPTAHAEVNALRLACRSLGSIDLTGAVLYTTCEPCPMCLAASHWARIARVLFGASIADAASAGFSELSVPAAELAQLGGSPLLVEPGPLRDDCRALFDEWKAARGHAY